MNRHKVLVQLDTDEQPSVFDSIVAVDAGIERILRHGNVTPQNVVGLVHGCIFTRGPDDLWRTAIFIGGSNVARAEQLLEAAKKTFFGPFRVSVMLDPNGANTTAAAAVLAAARHMPLEGARVLVLAATGPVGQRITRLLAREGASVRVGSRSLERSEEVCREVSARVADAPLVPCATLTRADLENATTNVDIVIAAGAAGVELLPIGAREKATELKVAIDLNAVAPAGIGGIEAIDKATDRDGVMCYGALGVGGTKMRIHKSAIQLLFESNEQVLDVEEFYALGRGL